MANEKEVRNAVEILKQFGEELGEPGQTLLSLAEEWLAGKYIDKDRLLTEEEMYILCHDQVYTVTDNYGESAEGLAISIIAAQQRKIEDGK